MLSCPFFSRTRTRGSRVYSDALVEHPVKCRINTAISRETFSSFISEGRDLSKVHLMLG
jgi:hypothetical protein